MRAVNLVPADAHHSGAGGGFSLGQLGPVHVVLGVLVIVLAYVTVYVLTGNTISQRKTQLTALHSQLTQEKAQVARLGSYTQFAQLAQQRAATVRQIAGGRFDWHGALTDLSKVMPANTTLQSITATVAPGASASGPGGSASSSSSSVRGAINAPAFEFKGCTATQDDVARFISRLRLINGVQRVTLEDSAKPAGGPGGAATAPASSPAAGSSGGCTGNGPTFDLVVFFQPLPGASAGTGSPAPAGASPTTPQGASTTASKVSNPSSSAGATK
jgi:Tfp pilus assembly protein PilN